MPVHLFISKTGNQAGRRCTGASILATFGSRFCSCKPELSWMAEETNQTENTDRNIALAPAPSRSPRRESPVAQQALVDASTTVSETSREIVLWMSCRLSCAIISKRHARVVSEAMCSALVRQTSLSGTIPSGGPTSYRLDGWSLWPTSTSCGSLLQSESTIDVTNDGKEYVFSYRPTGPLLRFAAAFVVETLEDST